MKNSTNVLGVTISDQLFETNDVINNQNERKILKKFGVTAQNFHSERQCKICDKINKKWRKDSNKFSCVRHLIHKAPKQTMVNNQKNTLKHMNGSKQIPGVTHFPSIRPSVRPSVRPPARPPARPTARPPVRPSVRPFVRPPVRPSVRPSVYLSIYLCIYLCIYLSIYLSIYYLSIYSTIHLSVYLSI